MLVFNERKAIVSFLEPLIAQKKTIGFVPTMGALHDGHLSLLDKSLKENDVTVMSIFVNPTQFNNPEDLEKYPRNLESDVSKVEAFNKNVLIFAPSVSHIYKNNVTSENFDFDGLENQMEGKYRPGHFDGVGTIVKRLFEIIRPTNAYFGEKDFQQLQIVKKMVEKVNLPVNVIGCPIFREKSGLAMSSRNERLSKEAKEKATIIFKILKAGKKYFEEHSALATQSFVEKEFSKHQDFKLEYFDIAEEKTLLPCIRKSKKKKYRGFVAVFIEDIRLIDNIGL
ncbi:MAG: pantoate--beta-alanine ligase [Flavobacteriaceae bacterium]|nr:pantoate--beta-alanine ligase [Flavobacteriaceae bacterium]